MTHRSLPPAGLDVRTGWNSPFRTVTVTGEVDMANARVLAVALSEAIDEHPPGVVLDLMSVTFFGATGVNTVLDAARHAAAHDVSFAVARGPHIARVLDMTGSRHLVDDQPSRHAALRALVSSDRACRTPVG